MSSLGAGLRRLRARARPRHAAPGAVAAGHRAVHRRRAWEDGRPVVASPRQILRAPARAAGRARLVGVRGHRARVHRLPRHLRGGLAQGLPRARAGQPLQRRLLAARHRARGAADPAHPQRDGRRRAARSRTPRASATSASTRSTSATPTRSRAADEHAIYKNGAKEIAAQEGMAITFMAKFDEREGNSCHIHFSLARRAGRLALFADDAADLRPLPRRAARLPARADAAVRPERQLLQALRGRLVRADRGRVGQRQPHVRAARRRPRRGRCASRTGCPGADVNPYLALSAMIAAGLHGIDSGARARARARGQRLRGRQAARARTRCATRASCSPRAASPARRSATRSSTTTSTTRASSSRPSTPRSPTGSASGGSSGCDRGSCRRHAGRGREGPVGSVGGGRGPAAAHLQRRRPARRRHRR